jgi:hypothetical protein
MRRSAAHGFREDARQDPHRREEQPGFVVNRILCPMLNEAILALQEGSRTPEDIDNGMKLGCSHPIGPLALCDMVGLDVLLAVMEVFYRDFNDPKYRPALLLKEMVAAGHLGRKSGRGFYNVRLIAGEPSDGAARRHQPISPHIRVRAFDGPGQVSYFSRAGHSFRQGSDHPIEIRDEVPLLMIADHALNPEDDREPRAARDRRNGMQHARRVEEQISRRPSLTRPSSPSFPRQSSPPS